jgi:pilus assembly protein CpaC
VKKNNTYQISIVRMEKVDNKLIAIFISLFLVFSTMAQEEPEKTEKLIEVEVPMSIEKIIKLDFVPNTIIKVANEQLVNYQVSQQKKEVMLVGQKVGETTMTLRDTAGDVKARYLIKVTSSDQTKVVGQLKDLLKDVEGLEIGIRGDKVYVGGQIVVPSDIGKVVVVLDGYPDVLRLVELSPHTQLIIAKKMQEEIQKSNLKDVTVRVVNGSFWIEGVVTTQDEKKMASQIATAYLPDQIQNLARRTDSVQSTKKSAFENLITVNEKKAQDPILKLFKITAQFVELTKSYDKVFGFGWTPTISNGSGQISLGKSTSGGVTTTSNGTLSATISNLIPKLNSAKSAGHARIIQSGVIVVKEKVEGQLNKTTTIPYTVGTGDNAKSGSAVAGLKLSVTPTMLQEEKIDLKININVSSTTGETTPTTLDNTISTTVIVKSQESAVIGGVVTNKTTTNFDKDAPTQETITNGVALFSFLKSKNYSTNRSQFVVFITPEIIESAATGVSEIERKFRKRSR